MLCKIFAISVRCSQNDILLLYCPLLLIYSIVTPFTIEPWQPEFGDNSPNKGVEQPIQGVMTTYGFLLPYPTKHRFAVWFTGGSCLFGLGGWCLAEALFRMFANAATTFAYLY